MSLLHMSDLCTALVPLGIKRVGCHVNGEKLLTPLCHAKNQLSPSLGSIVGIDVLNNFTGEVQNRRDVQCFLWLVLHFWGLANPIYNFRVAFDDCRLRIVVVRIETNYINNIRMKLIQTYYYLWPLNMEFSENRNKKERNGDKRRI